MSVEAKAERLNCRLMILGSPQLRSKLARRVRRSTPFCWRRMECQFGHAQKIWLGPPETYADR